MSIVKQCKKCGKEFVRANCLYCYDCLPTGLTESERRTALNKLERELNPIILTCPNCNKNFILPYGEVNRKYCYECMPKGLTKPQQTARMRQMGKIKALKLLGGQCYLCGFHKYPSSLEFHHINEEEKDFNLSNKIQGFDLSEEVLQELNKCIVLCSNCHRAYHAQELSEQDYQLIERLKNGN